MLPSYIDLPDTTPVVVPLNNNNHVFNVSIRVSAGVTAETTLESVQVTPSGRTPVWSAAPAASDGYIKLNFPVTAVRLTAAASGVATILQQGI